MKLPPHVWNDDPPDDWAEFMNGLPDFVREVVEKFPPWNLYRHKITGQRVMLMSYGETADRRVLLTVCVHTMFNPTPIGYNVFGVPPDSLEECDVPTEEQVAEERRTYTPTYNESMMQLMTFIDAQIEAEEETRH